VVEAAAGPGGGGCGTRQQSEGYLSLSDSLLLPPLPFDRNVGAEPEGEGLGFLACVFVTGSFPLLGGEFYYLPFCLAFYHLPFFTLF
jgi:hypothetical protein